MGKALIALLLIANGALAECDSACQAERENELWLSEQAGSPGLTQAFSDETVRPPQMAAINPQCAAKLQEKLQALPLNVKTVDHRSLCEIASVEAEWEVRLREMIELLPAMAPEEYGRLK